ncbi:DUF1206 domain-containing protein [Roseobacter sp. HKCCA0434]|uniref:DUF1206 domain-containing protein n=1 Tax=Roseobacter sp. HKCCA0434 TaxID=3079297 RepID=UPI002905C129|nr:DUF1206 domain-containing protein [Roseobacter sp. HKCCA0434]
MSKQDLSWALPVMRAGYAGRGIVYVVVAGVSLWSILMGGGEAGGPSETFGTLNQSAFGVFILALIALGMLAYAVWRVVDGTYDLEEYGDDAKGLIARAGMFVTGTLHLFIGFVALVTIFKGGSGGGEGSGGGSGGGSGVSDAVGKVLGWPGGQVLVGLAGLATIGAGIYYLHKAYKRKYREKLMGNHFTRNWDPALRAGVAAQGVIVLLIGGFILYAAITHNPDQAGGIGEAFAWLHEQAYGRILVILVCLGLLGFALFCFVNAVYRIVPRLAGDDLTTLATRMKNKAESTARSATS